MSLKNIPFGSPEKFNVVLEIPSGSQNKYEYDERLDALKLDFIFSKKFKFPHNYGYVPETRGGDGDPLDCFVLAPYPIGIGTIVECRPIGMIEVLDDGEEDNKILAVPAADGHHAKYRSINDLSVFQIDEFKNFFSGLAREKNKTMEIKGFHGKDRAVHELEKARRRFGANGAEQT